MSNEMSMEGGVRLSGQVLGTDIRQLDPVRHDVEFPVLETSTPRIRAIAHDFSRDATVWEVAGLLSADECRSILETVSACERTPPSDRAYRDAARLVAIAEQLTHALGSRLTAADCLPARIAGTTHVTPIGFATSTEWDPLETMELNPCIRISTYVGPSQGFAAHRDAPYTETETCMSDHSIVICLSGPEEYEGGDVTFYDARNTASSPCCGWTPAEELAQSTYDTLTLRYRACGTAFIFDQRLIHSAAPVTSGVKTVLRTDVLRRGKTVRTQAQTKPQKTMRRRLEAARALFRLAELSETEPEPDLDLVREAYERSLSLRQSATSTAKFHPRVVELLTRFTAVERRPIRANLFFVGRDAFHHVFVRPGETLSDLKKLAADIQLAAGFTLQFRTRSLLGSEDESGGRKEWEEFKVLGDWQPKPFDLTRIANDMKLSMVEDFRIEEADLVEDEEAEGLTAADFGCDEDEDDSDSDRSAEICMYEDGDCTSFPQTLRRLVPSLREAESRDCRPPGASDPLVRFEGRQIEFKAEFGTCNLDCSGPKTKTWTRFRDVSAAADDDAVASSSLRPDRCVVVFTSTSDEVVEGTVQFCDVMAETFNHASCQCSWEPVGACAVAGVTAKVTFTLSFKAWVEPRNSLLIRAVPHIIM